MAITSVADYELCRSTAQVYSFIKTIPGTASGPGHSTRAGGFPAAESLTPSPGVTFFCVAGQPGFPPVPWAPTGESNYLISMSFQTTGTTTPLVSLYDKLMYGSLNLGTQTTYSWTELDASHYNVAERIGRSDYSELQWWVEFQNSTAAQATIHVAVTMDNNATKTVIVVLPTGAVVGKLHPIFLDEPGRYIKKVTSVFVAETTGSSGISIVCTRHIADITMGSYETKPGGPNQHGLPKIPNQAALMLVNFSTGSITLTGYIKIGYG